MIILDRKTAHRLTPRSGLVKPMIRVGNYLFDNSGWEGIPAKEVPELKVFLKDVVPYLNAAVQAVELFQRNVEKTKFLKRQQAHEAFTPIIQLTRTFGDDVQYHLRFTWDGMLFLDREDSVMVPTPEGIGLSFSGIHVNQPVGELHRLESEETG